VARVKNGCQSDTGLERLDHDAVHLVVYDVTCDAEINRVNNLVVTIIFVTIQIRSLTTVACEIVNKSSFPSSGKTYQNNEKTKNHSAAHP
jgi:hypothetical protein